MKWWKKYTGYIREGITYSTYPFKKKNKPSKKFVIFTVGRSGSNLLVNLLDLHPDIHCNNELLSKRVVFPSLYLNLCENLSSRDVYGFKLLTYHFDIQKTTDYLNFIDELILAGYLIISLKRHNILRQAVSHIYALHRQKFHHKSKQGEQIHSVISVDIDNLKEELELFTDHREREEIVLEKYPYFQLFYEDDLFDTQCHQRTIDRISDYLGIPTAKVESDYLRTTPDHLSRFIENFNEVRDYISQTEFKEFLEDI